MNLQLSLADNEVKVLDYGYLRVLEFWGSDEFIIESARVSTNKGFLGWGTPDEPGDEKLLRFLYDKKHSTPFEFAGLTIEVQAPIMVFREWHRHRTQSYSEMSARYTPLPDCNYSPTPERCLVVNSKNKQAGKLTGSDELTHESVLEWLQELSDTYEHCERTYQSGLKRGIPKELARLPVPVGRYTRMRATTDLRNWLGFATLRAAPDAQAEIRQYAEALVSQLADIFPRTTELFLEFKRGP